VVAALVIRAEGRSCTAVEGAAGSALESDANVAADRSTAAVRFFMWASPDLGVPVRSATAMPTARTRVVYHRGMRILSRYTIASAATSLSLALLLGACGSSGEKKKDEDDKEATPVGEAVGEPAAPEADGAAAPRETPVSATRTIEEVRKAFDVRKESFRRVNSARASANAGTFTVTMTFAPSGEVVECRMLSTDFREDTAFNAAVMTEVWRVRIAPRPADAGEFTVNSYSIAFSARNEAAAVPPSMPILSAPAPSAQ
jgi:hypothetical protein